MAGGSSFADSRWKIATGAAIILFLILFARKLPAKTTEISTPVQQSQPQNAIAGSDADPFCVPWRDTKLADLDLKRSNFKCTDTDDVHRTCIFENMVMYRGDLWFIAPDSKAVQNMKLPNPLVFEVGNSPSNDFTVPAMIAIHTADTARAAIAATAPQNGNLKTAEYGVALLQRTRTFNNWFWALNGGANIFHRLCKYFDACTAYKIKQAAVLQPIIESSRNLSDVGYVGLPLHHARAVKDLMSCFGPIFWVNHPSGREVDQRPQDEVLIFRRILVGIGEDVVQPKAALDEKSRVRFKQAEPKISLKRVQFLRQCAALPPNPTPRTNPSILLVNRAYNDGRSILGLDDVADRLRRALPEDVPVRIFLPRGDAGIADQASAFDDATVVVAPHGAATANFNFLPLDAVALGVFALNGRWGHDEAVGASLPNPPYNVSVWKVDCRDSTEARANAAGEFAEFRALPAEDQVALLLGKDMGKERTEQVKKLLGMSLLDWMDYRSYAPDPEYLTQAVLDAVEEWRKKVALRRKNKRKR